jgi:RNA polymerase sigma-70 factor, ECF subfamily
LRGNLLPRADAKDAVQECYLRAFRYFDTFGGLAIKPWLFAILPNVDPAREQRPLGTPTISDSRARGG